MSVDKEKTLAFKLAGSHKHEVELLTEVSHLSDSQLSHALEACELAYADRCSDYVSAGEVAMPLEPRRLCVLRKAAMMRLR
jgi:hypothetical protein